MERLHKFLARAGVGSRRKCEELISAGLVRVNGQTVTKMGVVIDPESELVEVAGRVIKNQEEKIYILLNKPAGYISTTHDPQGRARVIDLIKNIKTRIYPVGRLDYETEGLLLLTNDGGLAYALTHPRHQIPKTYLAWVDGMPSAEKLTQMAKGVMLEDGLTAPAKVCLKGENKRGAIIEITIHEGRKRQVRRMCDCIGHPLYRLKRVRLGFLDLGGLKPGEYRRLTDDEVERIKKIASG
jgi:pseudouridine synthase